MLLLKFFDHLIMYPDCGYRRKEFNGCCIIATQRTFCRHAATPLTRLHMSKT